MDTIYCVECPKELKLPETDRVRWINNNNKPFLWHIFHPTIPCRHSNPHSLTQTAEIKKILPCTYTHTYCPHIETQLQQLRDREKTIINRKLQCVWQHRQHLWHPKIFMATVNIGDTLTQQSYIICKKNGKP